MEIAESSLSEFDKHNTPRLSWPVNNWLGKDIPKWWPPPLTAEFKATRNRERMRMRSRLRHAEGIAGMTSASQIEHETVRYFEVTARDGVLHQSLAYDTPMNGSNYDGPPPFEPREKKPSRQAKIQTQWEKERAERQLEKENLADGEWAAAEQIELRFKIAQAEADEEKRVAEKIKRAIARDSDERKRKKRLAEIYWAEVEEKERLADEKLPPERRKAARQQLEKNLGMTIKQAQRLFTPGPMLDDDTPDTSKWIYGVHAHIKLWYWKV